MGRNTEPPLPPESEPSDVERASRSLRSLVDRPNDTKRKKGPALKKARGPALVEHGGAFVRTSEGRWRELFEHADTISEGAIRDERGGRSWYGSTSLILSLPTGTPEEERRFLLSIAERDVHVHVHALRCAHREAQSRAPGLLGRVSCELRFSDDPKGLRIDVDVQAPLIERRRAGRAGP